MMGAGSLQLSPERRPARVNPFRVDRVLAIRYRPQGTSWDALLSRLRELQFRASVCGPQGSGKTTLLEDLAGKLTDAGLAIAVLQLRRETRQAAAGIVQDFLDSAAADSVLMVDGSEQLGRLAWRRLRRRSRGFAGLIVTSHTPGRLPTLINCRTDVRLLESIVAELVPDDIDRLRSQLPVLYAAHGGNLRLCLRSLYDAY